MLKTAQLPERFWAEAILIACYVKNKATHSAINNNVSEYVWIGNIPSVNLKVYGCLTYAHVPKQCRNKLEQRAKECILVRYSSKTKEYRLWDPSRDDVIQTKHVEFVEEICGFEYIYKRETYNIPINDEESVSEDNDTVVERTDAQIDDSKNRKISEGEEIETEIEKNKDRYNLRNKPARSMNKANTIKLEKVVRNPWGRTSKLKDIEINLTEIIELVTFEQAMESPQCNEWKAAMENELHSLESRKT